MEAAKHRTKLLRPGASRRDAEEGLTGSIMASSDGSPAFWRADPAGLWTWSCPQWTRVTGLSGTSSLGDGWLDAVHPQDRGAASRPPGEFQAMAGLARSALRIRLSGGGYRSMRSSAAPFLDADGRVIEWIGALLDSAAARPRRPRRSGELQHHLRNAIAVIRSVARRTARTSDNVEHYAAHFEGRLDAFARVQDALIRSPEWTVSLEELIREELMAHRVREAGFHVEGPDVRLRDRAAPPFMLAVHELAVNAVKFGALTSPGGELTVSWTVDHSTVPPNLLFQWRETGVAVMAPAPRHSGFGTEVIEKSLPYELNATTRLQFRPGEVRCTIELPLSDATALLEAH